MITHLGLTGAERASYERAVDATEAVWPSLLAALPQQLIHSDYVGVNILLEDGTVSGVLDFVFSAPDLRAMDLASSIWSFCLRNYIGRDESRIAPLVRAFLAGYSERLTVTREEWTSLPALLRDVLNSKVRNLHRECAPQPPQPGGRHLNRRRRAVGSDPAPAEPLCHRRRRAAAAKGVEHEVAQVAGRADDPLQPRLRLLCRIPQPLA